MGGKKEAPGGGTQAAGRVSEQKGGVKARTGPGQPEKGGRHSRGAEEAELVGWMAKSGQ